MMTLFIDACPRRESRTRELAAALLACLPADTVQTVALKDMALPPVTEAALAARTAGKPGTFTDLARQFAAADRMVIAAPFWDLSFPAVLKRYLELVCVTGITFCYGENGRPQGLCRAESLYYVTTGGGVVGENPYGFGYVRALATQLWGIPTCRQFKAENLDVIGTDIPAALAAAKREIQNAFSDRSGR